MLKLALREFGKEVVEVIEVVASVKSILKENPHLLGCVVLVHGDQAVVVDGELIVLPFLLPVQLDLLGPDDHVACQGQQMVVVDCVKLTFLDVVVVYDVVSPSHICLDKGSVHSNEFFDELAIWHSCEEVISYSWVDIDWPFHFVVHFSLLSSPLRACVHIMKRKIFWLGYLVSSIHNDTLVYVPKPIQLLDED